MEKQLTYMLEVIKSANLLIVKWTILVFIVNII